MYGRLRWNKPAQTITSGYGSMGQGRYVHPGRRRHSLRTRRSPPDDPDWFDLKEATTRAQLAHMIGTAVPPLLGLDIGRLVLPLFSSSAWLGCGAATPCGLVQAVGVRLRPLASSLKAA